MRGRPEPNLQDVKRARKALERYCVGRVVADAISDPHLCRPQPPEELREVLVGHRVSRVEQTGILLEVRTDGPALGIFMSGSSSLRFDDPTLRLRRLALAFTDSGSMALRNAPGLSRATFDKRFALAFTDGGNMVLWTRGGTAR